jgi:cytochrome P450
MSFLAPQALTIMHGEQWRRLRRFNEATLQVSGADARERFIVDAVRSAFPGTVSDIGDIRRCMAQAMLPVVFGPRSVPVDLAYDLQRLFGHVQSPGRRMLLGWTEAGRRRRFYEALRRLWRESTESGEPSLLSTARGTSYNGSFTEEELIQQIPHWMFTFTGSGTDLLARTLGIVASRNDVYDRVYAEAMGQNSTNLASEAMRMKYLEACLLEVCRLFPPVTRTFHAAPRGETFEGFRIPAGMEILHCFAANQRDVSRDPTANDFRPERWMEPGSNAEAMYPSLFLGGARDCPGKGLILLVCKMAILKLIQYGRMRSKCPALSQDPLPLSYPESGLRYHVQPY